METFSTLTDSDWPPLFVQLLGICGSAYVVPEDYESGLVADFALRKRAVRLLARELTTRLRVTDRDHRAIYRPADGFQAFSRHPAFRTLDDDGDHGGEASAEWYLHRSPPRQHSWIGTVPQTPELPAVYTTELTSVMADAATLLADFETQAIENAATDPTLASEAATLHSAALAEYLTLLQTWFPLTDWADS